ncbi:hypothetical protein [Sphingobacterium kitahiroshimense]|uniref:hypothetical protein n=2 Tax=Sphingobacterium TaxID=28453 RepID=UPI00320A9958
MKKSKEEILASFLKDIHAEWVSAIPELTDAFEEIRFVKGEYLTNNWGELYLISEGIFGKYEKTCPVRYAIRGESLMIPNHRHNYQFISLSDCRTFMTTRKQLYEINAKNPNLLPIYIGLMEKQQNYLDYRQHLRDLPNIDKYPFLLEKYPNITKYVTQIELAQFMGMSREYLRQQQRNYD